MKVRTQFNSFIENEHTLIQGLSPTETIDVMAPSQELFQKTIDLCMKLTRCNDSYYEISNVAAVIMKSPADFNMYLSILMDYDIDILVSEVIAREKIIYSIAAEFV